LADAAAAAGAGASPPEGPEAAGGPEAAAGGFDKPFEARMRAAFARA
jgi:hypothetical protein